MSVTHYSPLNKDIKSWAVYFSSQLSVKMLTILVFLAFYSLFSLPVGSS